MMVKIGDFFFRYRNALFPFVFALLFFEGTWPICNKEIVETWEMVVGILVALSGQTLRALPLGLLILNGAAKKTGLCGKARSKRNFCTLQESSLFREYFNPSWGGDCRKFSPFCFVWNSNSSLCLRNDYMRRGEIPGKKVWSGVQRLLQAS